MKIYLVTAPGHEGSGYGDALVTGGHPEMLVSFMDFASRDKALKGFVLSGKTFTQEPRGPEPGLLRADDA